METRGYKVLHITPWFPPDRGGIATHVSALSENLTLTGTEVSIAAPRNILEKRQQIAKNDILVTRIKSIFFPGWPYPTLRSVSVPIDVGMGIRSIIKHGGFDLVHVHDLHYPLCWIAIFFAKRYNIPSILTLHGMYGLNPNVIGGKTRAEELMYKYLFSRIISRSTAVIGLTQKITRLAQTYGGDNTRYFTLANGVKTEVYRNNLLHKQKFKKKYGIQEDSPVVLFVGRLEHVKGILEFANAMKEIVQHYDARVEILIVGSGSLETEVYNILKHIDRVHLVRWHPNESIHELYIASDIFVIPSKFEGLPLTVVEAMNSNLHIVYSPVGGIPEILEGYSMKTVLNEVTSNEILRVTTKLLQRPMSVKDENSLIYAQKFDWYVIVQELIKIYEILIKNRS